MKKPPPNGDGYFHFGGGGMIALAPAGSVMSAGCAGLGVNLRL